MQSSLSFYVHATVAILYLQLNFYTGARAVSVISFYRMKLTLSWLYFCGIAYKISTMQQQKLQLLVSWYLWL